MWPWPQDSAAGDAHHPTCFSKPLCDSRDRLGIRSVVNRAGAPGGQSRDGPVLRLHRGGTSEPGKGRGLSMTMSSFLLSSRALSVAASHQCPSAPLRRGTQDGWTSSCLSPSRFKYVLINASTGLVQDQTLWSDPIRTNRRKQYGWAGHAQGAPGQGQAQMLRTGSGCGSESLQHVGLLADEWFASEDGLASTSPAHSALGTRARGGCAGACDQRPGQPAVRSPPLSGPASPSAGAPQNKPQLPPGCS